MADSKARYALVRVDDNLFCPGHFEKIRSKFCCTYDNDLSCSGCKFGDTPEQFINKIETVLNRLQIEMKKETVLCISNKGIAHEIGRFLGVKR